MAEQSSGSRLCYSGLGGASWGPGRGATNSGKPFRTISSAKRTMSSSMKVLVLTADNVLQIASTSEQLRVACQLLDTDG